MTDMTVDWGDGKTEETPSGKTLKHAYDPSKDGITQNITVCRKDQPAKCKTLHYTPGKAPDVKVTPDDGGDGKPTVEVTPAEGSTYAFDGGEAKDVPADGTVPLDDLTPGDHTLKVCRKGVTPPVCRETTVTIPTETAEGPKVEVGKGSKDNSAVATVTPKKGKTYTYAWDNDAPADVPADGHLPEKELTPGEHTLKVCEKGATPPVCTEQKVTIPIGGQPPTTELKLTTVGDPADKQGYTITATVDNGGKPAAVDFGDKTPPVDNPGDGKTPTPHAYTTTGTYTVTATDKADPSRKAESKVTIPAIRVSAHRNPDDDSGLTVDVYTGNDPDLDAGDTIITWAEGTPETDTNPGDGETPTTHTFPTPGEKTIKVVDADDPSRTGQVTVTLPLPKEPGPLEIDVVEDRRDPTHMTVIAYADNKGVGPVTVDVGDNSGLVTPGTGVYGAERKYAKAGEYTITATDRVNPDRKATTKVTVPFPN